MSNISPYTRVIAECLESLDEVASDDAEGDIEPVMHLLINMLQGRMLEHIKQRVSTYYNLGPEALGEEFSVALVEVFSEIFGAFRKKFEDYPWLVCHIGRRVVQVEMKNGPDTEKRINQFYLAIFCKYFEYKNVEKIISTLQTDPRIQCAILPALPSRSLYTADFSQQAYGH